MAAENPTYPLLAAYDCTGIDHTFGDFPGNPESDIAFEAGAHGPGQHASAMVLLRDEHGPYHP